MKREDLVKISEDNKKYKDGDPEGKKAVFSAMDLTGSDFSGLDFDKADFSMSNMSGCDLSNATFTNVNCFDCNFTNAILVNCLFTDSVLNWCNFTDANMSGVNIEGCGLRYAIGNGAEVKSARLYNAVVAYTATDIFINGKGSEINKGLKKIEAEIKKDPESPEAQEWGKLSAAIKTNLRFGPGKVTTQPEKYSA